MAGTYQDFLTALGSAESSNRYYYVNNLGHAGYYQFTEIALRQIGYRQPDGTSYNDWRSSGWTGKDGINSLSEWLNTPWSQNKAAGEWFNHLWDNQFEQLGITKYVGQWINGVKVTESGMLAGAHLVGAPALARYLNSGGDSNSSDPYGTTVASRLSKFGGYDVSSITGTSAPPSPSPGSSWSGQDTITVRARGDSYQGDPNFAISVDGKLIDSTNTVTADRADNEWQTFTFTGDFDAPGTQAHRIAIEFTNDAYSGSATDDRNLYVDQVTLNGVVNGTNAPFYWEGQKSWDLYA